jgi:hypothetical protein
LNRIPLLLLLILLFVGVSAVQAQHPIGYGSLHATSQMGTFSFEDLDRTILKEKTAAFYINRQLDITFEVLVTPNGIVKYVRSPRVTSEFYELRLACASALYDFVFSPVATETGDRWFKAKLKFEED